MLYDDYMIAAHFEHIGMNLSETASLFPPIESINSYRARLDEKIVHQLIRHDPGVKLVQHDNYARRRPRGLNSTTPKDAIPQEKRGPSRRETNNPPKVPWWCKSCSSTPFHSSISLFSIWKPELDGNWFQKAQMITAGYKLPLPVIEVQKPFVRVRIRFKYVFMLIELAVQCTSRGRRKYIHNWWWYKDFPCQLPYHGLRFQWCSETETANTSKKFQEHRVCGLVCRRAGAIGNTSTNSLSEHKTRKTIEGH